MKTLLTVIATTSLLVSANALAQKKGDVYGEVAYVTTSIKDESSSNLGTFKPSAGRLTLGSVVAENIAVEGLIQHGLSASSHMVGTANIELKLKTGYGLAVRPFMNLNDKVEVYGRLGSVRSGNGATATLSNGTSVSTSDRVTNTMYGGGLVYKVSDKVAAVLDYTKLNKKDDTAVSMVAVGLRFGF